MKKLNPAEMAVKHKLVERGGSYSNPLPKPPGKHAHKQDSELTPQQRYERNSRLSYRQRNRAKCNSWRKAYERKRCATDPEYKERRREQVRQQQQRRRLALRAILFEARDCPCTDCGIRLPPTIMDFDHVRGVKEFNLGGVVGSATYRSAQAIKDEIAKCDVRCPTCHRLRHYFLAQKESLNETN